MAYDQNDLRMALAQQLMGGTGMGAPRSIGAGLTDMGTRLAGAMLARKTMDKQQAQQQEFGKMLQDFSAQPGAGGPDSARQLAGILAGSSNPIAQEAGQQLLVRSMLTQPREEKFGQPVTVMGPEGKPVLAQFGSQGTPRPISGFSPNPAEMKAPTTRTIPRGGEEVVQEWKNGQWEDVGGGPRWNPDSAARVSVNVGGPQVTFPRPETEKAADVELGKSLGQMAGTLVKDSTQRTQDLQAVNSSEKLLNYLESSGGITPGLFAEKKADISRAYHAVTGTEVPKDVQDFRTLSAQLNKDVLGMIGKGGIPANNFSDADRKFIQMIATSPSDDPGTLRAKFAIRRASIKAEDYVTKEIMDLRRQGVPTETAVTQAMGGLQNKNFVADEPAVQRWMAQNQGGAPAMPAGPPGSPPAGVAAPTAKKRIKIDAQGNIIQ